MVKRIQRAEPSTEPVTLAEARAHLRLDTFGSPPAHPEDDLISLYISAARQFCEDMDCAGFDINPKAIEWLKKERRWHNLLMSEKPVDHLTFWDSLEHIHDPETILSRVKDSVFVSMPIYENAEHILKSKHFRKDEHCWYFTDDGLKLFMSLFGFECERQSTGEQLYREDIHTYHFRRVNG